MREAVLGAGEARAFGLVEGLERRHDRWLRAALAAAYTRQVCLYVSFTHAVCL